MIGGYFGLITNSTTQSQIGCGALYLFASLRLV